MEVVDEVEAVEKGMGRGEAVKKWRERRRRGCEEIRWRREKMGG